VSGEARTESGSAPAQARHEALAAIERAAVRSWPALETAGIEGWLWRHTSGGSQRANSVAALAFTGADPDAAIAEAERRYRAKGAPCWFTISEVSEPGDLDRRLAARGYVRGPENVTMAKLVSAGQGAPDTVTHAPDPEAEWLAVYLAGLGADRRPAAPGILARLPAERAFFACRRDGSVVATGLSVADGGLASVQCMTTLAAARRQGCAREVLAAIEAWARAQGAGMLYLQTEAANAPAVALYEGFGFRLAGRYHLRVKA